jgi:hypothetical protein
MTDDFDWAALDTPLFIQRMRRFSGGLAGLDEAAKRFADVWVGVPRAAAELGVSKDCVRGLVELRLLMRGSSEKGMTVSAASIDVIRRAQVPPALLEQHGSVGTRKKAAKRDLDKLVKGLLDRRDGRA